MIDLNSHSGLSDRINWLIDDAIDREPEEKRDYLGCSAIGAECLRSTAYDFLKTTCGANASRKVELNRPGDVTRETSRLGSVEPYSTRCLGCQSRLGSVEPYSTRYGNQFSAEFLSCPSRLGSVEPHSTRCDNQVSARIKRIFERGHVMEDKAARWLMLAGFMLATIDPLTGQQFEVIYEGGRIKGHADGILTMWRGKGPTPIELPALWECKCLGHKWWMKAKKDHIRQSHPKYYAQMQLYMRGLNLEQGLITCVNADTCELYHEIVPFDVIDADKALQKGIQILASCDAGELPPRKEKSPQSVTCKMCHWHKLCWT